MALAAGALTVATGAARADWSAGAGFEGFKWKESTSPTVKESGLRWAFDLTWQQTREPGVSAGYNVKLYVGNVDYTGATLFGGLPVSGETHYRGLQNEVQAIYRTPQSVVDVVLAAGWDHWTRELSSIQREVYDVLYARFGAAMGGTSKQGFLGSIGVKYPLYARENADFQSIGFSSNPRLRPGRDFSLYGSLGYRVNPNWDVIGYYDSYRFKQSNSVIVAGAPGIVAFQPESKQDVLGMKIQHNF